jgi:hypothetical protein
MALGQQFRVENAVYLDTENRPYSQSTTIFVDGKVYDYLHQPEEVVIFDPAERRFVFLSPELRIRTELRLEQVAAFISSLRSWALKQNDEFLRFSALPELQVRQGVTGTDLIFEADFLSYRVEVDRPPRPEIARLYAQFSDWYSQLNTMLTPGSRLPFARMYVNKILMEKGFVPLWVELRLTPPPTSGSKPALIRSHHKFFYRLDQAEIARATQADQFAAIFPNMSFLDYQQKLLARTPSR